MSKPMFRPGLTPLRLLAGTAVAAVLFGLAAGGAQAADPLPLQQEASLPANGAPEDPTPIPLGPENTREVQNQLIALGFDPGPVDGEVGPATVGAAQQYDLSRGGSGRVSIDGAFLARLKADTAPRLTYDQVAARSQAHGPAQSSQSSAAQTSAPAATSNQFGNVVQQIVPLIGAAIANSNANRGYGPGYYGPGPGYYGPPPGYYGYGYGGY